jgi:hypothetical protein
VSEEEFANALADAADLHLRRHYELDPIVDEVDEDVRGGMYFDVRFGAKHFEIRVREVIA